MYFSSTKYLSGVWCGGPSRHLMLRECGVARLLCLQAIFSCHVALLNEYGTLTLTCMSDSTAAMCCPPSCHPLTSAGTLMSAHLHQMQTGQFHPVAAQPPAPAPLSMQARGAAAAALAAMMTGAMGQPHHGPDPAPLFAMTRRALEGMTTEGSGWCQWCVVCLTRCVHC